MALAYFAVAVAAACGWCKWLETHPEPEVIQTRFDGEGPASSTVEHSFKTGGG
jgi:hypothetical protein